MDADDNKILTKTIAFIGFLAHCIMCCSIIAFLMRHDLQCQGTSDLSAKTTEPTSHVLFVPSLFPHVKEA